MCVQLFFQGSPMQSNALEPRFNLLHFTLDLDHLGCLVAHHGHLPFLSLATDSYYQQATATMPPRKFHDWQEDHHRRLAAEQACILHDAITDIVKLSLGIDLAVGCRASVNGVVETEIATLVRDPAHDGVEWACEQISRRSVRKKCTVGMRSG